MTVTVTATPTDPVTLPRSVTKECAPKTDVQITVFEGLIDCATSYLIAARYDLDGAKRQNIDGYVCESGTIETLPTIFTCTNREVGAEFTVDER